MKAKHYVLGVVGVALIIPLAVLLLPLLPILVPIAVAAPFVAGWCARSIAREAEVQQIAQLPITVLRPPVAISEPAPIEHARAA